MVTEEKFNVFLEVLAELQSINTSPHKIKLNNEEIILDEEKQGNHFNHYDDYD